MNALFNTPLKPHFRPLDKIKKIAICAHLAKRKKVDRPALDESVDGPVADELVDLTLAHPGPVHHGHPASEGFSCGGGLSGGMPPNLKAF